MRYVGGKYKIVKPLSEALLANTDFRKYYLEPFVGGGSVFSSLAPHFAYAEAGDLHPDLVLMWNALLFEGWEPPTDVSEEVYAALKTAPPSADRGFIGMGGSFGGKWFGGYARGKKSDGTPRNYQAEAARAMLRIKDNLSRTTVGIFRNWSYDQWTPLRGTVVYCDPPYTNTQGYSTGGFDSSTFWHRMEEWSEAGCKVFVSEYEAPDHWDCLWETQKNVSLGGGSNSFKSTERLFTLK